MRSYLRRINREGATVGAVIWFVGLVLLGGCAYFGYSNVTLLVFGHRNDGVVSNDSCYKGHCTSTIRFTGADGQIYEKTTASSNLSNHSSRVEIAFYQQPGQAPDDVTINTFGMMWLGPLIAGLLGSVFSFVGFCLVMQSLPARRAGARR